MSSVVNSGFSQVIHDQPDFPFKEAVAVFVVIDIGQCLCQGGVFTHPAVEFLQGEHGGEARAVMLYERMLKSASVVSSSFLWFMALII